MSTFAERLAMFSGGNSKPAPAKPKYTPPAQKPERKVGEPKPEDKKKEEPKEVPPETTQEKPKNYVKSEKIDDYNNPAGFKSMEEKRKRDDKELLGDFRGFFNEFDDADAEFGWK